MTEYPRYEFHFDDDFNGDMEDEYLRPEPVSVEQILFHIDNLEESGILPANVVYSLSDLYGESFEEFKAGWRYIESQKRLRAIQTLAELCETNYDLGYELLAYLGFEDEMPEIRAASVDLVWFDASEKLFHRLMALAEDHSPIVRAAAISGLGRFIYEAEVAHFNGQLAEMARDFVVERYYDYLEDVQVRRSALEAASQGSHPAVPDMILEAYQSPEHEMRVSALFAMGASCDTERWRDIVMQELDSQYPDMRFQAARAAGELVLEEAVIKLFELANEPDYEIKTQAIISLGDIGSNEAKRSLNALAERATQEGDNDLLEVIEEAIEYSSFMGGLLLPMFDFDEDNEDYGYFDEDEEF